MSRSSFRSAERRVPSTAARSAAATLGLLLAVSGTLCAQTDAPDSSARTTSSWELVFSSGALVPTGASRKVLDDAPLSTAQLAYLVNPRLAITSTVGWARSRDLTRDGDPKLSVFTYDVGVEVRAPRWPDAQRVSVTPFAGGGAGGRSFNHRGRDIDATHAMTGYLSAGGEFAAGRARVRLEVRDYLTGMAPLIGTGARAARNDVALVVGLRLVRKQGRAD